MKKLLLTIFFTTTILFTIGQQVPRDQVLLEIGTGTWCYYCPGAALGADDLIANGKSVAVIEHHGPIGSDPYATTASVARNTFYGLTGYPTAWFDGGNAVVGGNHTSSMYGSYLPKYNQRIAVQSSFTLQLNGFNDGSDYTVVVSADRVAAYSGSDLVLQLVLTESEISYSWQGLSDLNFVNRLMVPNQNGTPIDFSSSNQVSKQLNFTLDPGWVTEHLELIAFIQDNTTKEVVQATKVMLTDLPPMFFNNATCMQMSMVPVMNCSGEVGPTVSIENEGAEDLTTLDINYRVNNESVNTYNWTGNLGYGELANVDLPMVSFDIKPGNNLMVYTSNPNGNPDEDPINDTINMDFMAAQQIVPDVYLYLKLDDHPEEITYQVKNSAGTVMYSGGPYADAGGFVKDTFQLTMNDCYTFAIYDESGDGLTGAGYYALRQADFSLIYENDMFSSSQQLVQFSTDMVGINESDAASAFSVYPNPAHDVAFVNFNIEKITFAKIEIYNLMGEKVLSSESREFTPGNHQVKFSLGELSQGVYFVNLKSRKSIKTLKISVN